jgi:lipoprotein-anchoring transpeptidase ErfK/SrfK
MSRRADHLPNPSGPSRRGSALALIAGGTGCALFAPARAAANRVAASQPLVVLLHDHTARTAPSANAGRIEAVNSRRPLTRVRTSTPTPRGVFFVEEALVLSSYEAGGPYALASSARSNVFQEFEGGPGQIGIHGTDNLTGTPGTAASHGCIRPRTRAITWLARRVGAGVPLTVTR